MPVKCNYQLKPYTLASCHDAFSEIIKWAQKYQGDIANAFNATTRLNYLCRVVETLDGRFAAVIYPDFDRFNEHVLYVHSVLSDTGIRSKDNQIEMLRQYLNIVFYKEGFHKVVLEFPAICKLNARMAESVGMRKEGTLREEWPINGKYYDVYRYSILKSEWEVLNNGQKEINA